MPTLPAMMESGDFGECKLSEVMTDMLALVDEYDPCMLFEHIFLEHLPENIWITLEDDDFKSPHQVAHRAFGTPHGESHERTCCRACHHLRALKSRNTFVPTTSISRRRPRSVN